MSVWFFSHAADSVCGQESDQNPATTDLQQINQRLARGQLTRVVCFGDSITGAYYHTGGLRAWCDMLGFALQKASPHASLQMFNSGISGNTTVDALARIDRDVIAVSPHLVVVMFGMNDVTRVSPEAFAENLNQIVQRCRLAGAAVVLCTPNPVFENPARSEQKLAQYSQIVQSVAASLNVPLVDFFREESAFREEHPSEWSLTMSDEIHPNMRGHIRFAERIAEVICGRTVSVADTPSPYDGLHHTFDRLHQRKTVRLVAMPPYDGIFPDQLRKFFPEAQFDVTVWPVQDQSVAEMAEWAQQIRGLDPHLVVPAIPLQSLSDHEEGSLIADYEWVLNRSFQFSGRPWDVVPVVPLDPGSLTELQQDRFHLCRTVTTGKDVRFIERQPGDEQPAADLVGAWIAEQWRIWQGTRDHLPLWNGHVEIPVQSWPQRPGPRTVRLSVHYPGGNPDSVDSRTGIMLTLHNWGGEDCVGTADPDALARRLNVIAVCVNYLQSGRVDSIEAPEPYDFGYLQALDALRALTYVRNGLRQAERVYDDGRLFCTGGSGGGNVTLMANKLAPRTFACVIDLCGMKKLSDDIAFNLPGGSGLNARWSRDPQSRNYLTQDEQSIRQVGHPDHLKVMRKLQAESRIIIVHGRDDATCPFADAQELVVELQKQGFHVEPHFISGDDLDGKVFTSAGHALGNRTEIVFRVAGDYLKPDSPAAVRRQGATDFDRGEEIEYPTPNGRFVISYASGRPEAAFVPGMPVRAEQVPPSSALRAVSPP